MDSTPLPLSRTPASHSSPFTQESGFLFHRNSLLGMAGVLLLSAWEGLVTLVVLLGLVLAAALLAKAWARFSLVQVSCKRHVKERRLFPGDRTELSLELANRKLLPLPWVEIEDAIPPQLLEEKYPPSARRPDCALPASFFFVAVVPPGKMEIFPAGRKKGLLCSRASPPHLGGPLRFLSPEDRISAARIYHRLPENLSHPPLFAPFPFSLSGRSAPQSESSKTRSGRSGSAIISLSTACATFTGRQVFAVGVFRLKSSNPP